MYINQVIYELASADEKKVPMKNRHRQYFLDLYARYQMTPEMNLDGCVYLYDHMGKQLFDALSRQCDLNKIEALFFSHDGYALESNYASPELFWKEHYKITADIFDIKEIGILCVFCAIHCLLHVSTAYRYTHNVCCTIENAWLTVCGDTVAIFPEVDYVGALWFTNQINSNLNIKVLFSDLVHESNVSSYCENNATSVIYYVKEHVKNKLSTLYENFNFKIVNFKQSSGFIYFCIQEITKALKTMTCRNIVIVDYDIRISSFGFIFLQLPAQEEV